MIFENSNFRHLSPLGPTRLRISSPTRHPPYGNDSSKNSVIPAQPPPHRCRALPFLLTQMGYGPSAACESGVEKQTIDQ